MLADFMTHRVINIFNDVTIGSNCVERYFIATTQTDILFMLSSSALLKTRSMTSFPISTSIVSLFALHCIAFCQGLAPPASRRDVFRLLGLATAGWTVNPPAWADSEGGVNVDQFLKTGMVAQPMGVSGQAGKSKPETGVILRYVD